MGRNDNNNHNNNSKMQVKAKQSNVMLRYVMYEYTTNFETEANFGVLHVKGIKFKRNSFFAVEKCKRLTRFLKQNKSIRK